MEKYGGCSHFYGISGMHNPFLMKGMKEALDRIVKAVNNGEKIVIYGYHDIDGVTAVSVLLLVLKYLNADVEYFISDKAEGDFYSDSADMRKQFSFLGASLIITAGCGSNYLSAMKYCRKCGIDVIVTDCHEFEDVPYETILVNPKQNNSGYPCKNLTASGVAYKLAQAISLYYRMKCINKYLDLVMIGIISKNFPISGENQVMVEHGMHHLGYTNNYGLKAMMKINKIDCMDYDSVKNLIHNSIAALNNVRGVDNARIMVELFTTSSSDRAEQIAKYLKKEIKHKQATLLQEV